jgi:hypothetical protein
MEIARNGLAFVKLSLERDFRITNVLEQAKLTRLIIQLFPDLNPHLNRGHTGDLLSLHVNLPAYEEISK